MIAQSNVEENWPGGASSVRADVKQHASHADLQMRKRTSNDYPTGWLSPPGISKTAASQ
jgi:hypothetical protein